MKKIATVADYEVTHMGVLRLEDYMSILAQAALLLRIDPLEMLGLYDTFLSFIKQLPLEKVKVAQCVSNNPLVLKFYEETKLSNMILLNTNNRKALPLLLKVWEQSTSYGLFMGTTDYQPAELSRIQTTEIMMNLKRLEIVDIFQRLQRGIKFIEFIKGNVDACPCYKELLETNLAFQKQYLQDIIIKYGIVLDAYSDAFLRNDLNAKDLCQVGRQLLKLAGVDMLPEKLKEMVKLYQADNINHALR